jgi:hypothetical protein
MKITRTRACSATLLALVFLLAQFHLCSDLSAGYNTHFCPFCSTTATAITSQPPVLGIAPAGVRLEIAPPRIEIATAVATSISPRAPPAL